MFTIVFTTVLHCFTSVYNCFYTVLQGFVCPFFYLAKINGFQCDNAPQEESLTIQVFTTVFSTILKVFTNVFYCFASVYNVLQVVTTVFTLFYNILSVLFLFGENKWVPVWQCSSRRIVNHTSVYNCFSTILKVFTNVFYCFASVYNVLQTVTTVFHELGFYCHFDNLATINGRHYNKALQEELSTIQVITTVFPLLNKCLQLFFFQVFYNCFTRVNKCFSLFYK